MGREALQTLFYPFETGVLEWPQGPVLFLGAEPGFRAPAADAASLLCVQGFRPHYLALQREGFTVAPVADGEGYAASLVLCSRFRAQNEAWIAEALARTRPGGVVLVGGAKSDGIASLRKRIGGLLSVAGSASKYHGVVFWLDRPISGLDQAITALAPPTGLAAGRFYTAPGGFSADGIDTGSRLLADHLPSDLRGSVADFCAGWGYLSARLADLPDIRSIDLYEADFASLEAARKNLAGVRPAIAFHWHDLAAEPVAERYEVIVMNPPFHQGRAAEPDLGLAMIAAARAALKSGGRLFLVANRGLPYERALAEGFRAHGEILREGSYKVLGATR